MASKLNKLLILIVLFIITIIACRYNNAKKFINEKLLSNDFPYNKIKTIYNKYLGDVMPVMNISSNEQPVFYEKIEYSSIDAHDDFIVLTVENNYLVPAFYDGVVVFVGNKDKYKDLVIVNSKDVYIYYFNINAKVEVYDEIKKGEYVGFTKDDKLYLSFTKNNKVLDYKEFIK